MGLVEVFSGIYKKGCWGSRTSVTSRSGPGSAMETTVHVRAAIPEIIRDFGCQSLLDIPCGDFFWMQHVDLGSCEYLGADIVPELVAENTLRYPTRRFVVLDITRTPLPGFDLVLCRDCFIHLSNENILNALHNIIGSPCKYLLTTTFTNPDYDNPDILDGAWHAVNLERPPFNLPKPLCFVPEDNPPEGWVDKGLGLWKVSELHA